MWQGGKGDVLDAAEIPSVPVSKKPKLLHETTQVRKSDVLPQWYASMIQHRYTYNHTMPYLKQLRQELSHQVPGLRNKDVKVYRCSGLHCPAHLYHRHSLYIHGSNGVYVGFQVYILVV